MNIKSITLPHYIFLAIGLLAGGLLGHYFARPIITGLQVREGQASLINPLLSCRVSDTDVFQEFAPLKSQLQTLVDKALANKKAEKISVYFHDLNNGHWTGINGNEKYAPASLIKIPMMITYFRIAQDNPAILNKKLLYSGPDQNSKESIKPSHTMTIGESYTVSDLINRMIIYSDNNAIDMLYTNMDPKTLQQVFTDLHISIPSDSAAQDGDYISAKTFSFFFRTLYNATYLNRDYSDKTLEILSQSEFKDGIVAGLPTDAQLTIAHKFGEHPVVDQTNTVVAHQLHDCGIVYYPNHPYALCVMTQGTSYTDLESVIKDVSSSVYQQYKRYYK